MNILITGTGTLLGNTVVKHLEKNFLNIIATYNNTVANNESIVDLLSKQEYSITERSKLTAPTQLYPIGYLTNRTTAPTSTSDPTIILRVSPRPNAVNANCILLPVQPVWGFTTVTLGQYVFDAPSSKNFEFIT